METPPPTKKESDYDKKAIPICEEGELTRSK